MEHNLSAGIPERHTRFTQLPNGGGHNAVWDFVRSPDDRFYISVCGENEKPLTALLYEYDPKTGGLRLMFDVADIWIVDPQQMPPSKIHTSIDFLPDGRLIMATHNTAPAPGHKQWMFEQHYEDIWEGYPGSILMIVNPDTNDVQVKGIPVPRESIYGGMLGNDPRYYYFLGYMKGHFYRLDLETNEVKDYGKVSEFSSCRLVKDDKGRLYGSSYTGGLWRYDPDRDEIEDLKASFDSPNGTKHRRQFIFALHSPRGTLFMVDNMDGEMIELHPETLEITRHGPIYLRHQIPGNPYGIGGLAADENFVLYYGLKTYDDYYPIRLVRWDILNGGEPENLGVVAPQGKDSQYICEMIFDRDGWLHMVDVCGEFSPYVLAVETKKLQPPGPEAPPVPLRPYTEPDWNGVGSPAFMHIRAKTVRTLPLHRYMDWRDTAVKHVCAGNGRVYAIGGKDRVYLIASDYSEEQPRDIAVIYETAAAVSCMDADAGKIAVLAADGAILLVDPLLGSSGVRIAVPAGSGLARLHFPLEGNELIASDRNGCVYVCDAVNGGLRLLPDIHVGGNGAELVKLDNNRILLSGNNDEMFVYDIAAQRAETLSVRAASIRGRAFKATVTGGAVLGDGTVVAGTADGMLFTITSDLKRTIAYGRLHSSGQLRNFIKRSEDEVLGIYGGVRDAGHLFHFARESGFVDLGRPRVIKDNIELRDADTEWACIHYISHLAYDRAEDCLSVASGESYGCVIRYKGVECP
ncbi:hypothetical protein [Paenibacillus contaminans]|uniref:WD40 repeat domain-containing protein n=1 Tax=Paenibacillus contaminans TaxID=450362 RepID=A0A329MC87_9BACL|nr:hypothetical protein [Paenibacillus contaminans]RAV17705.1 hypothetical protein DQG23_26640 [Paenibacillus contaminans]